MYRPVLYDDAVLQSYHFTLAFRPFRNSQDSREHDVASFIAFGAL